MIILPVNETRKIQHYKLGNGMNIVTIYDKNTKSSAASMAVKVGHSSNPDNINGLAHYLEHMLFMGSKKYPRANHFFQELNKYSGNTNAFTSETATVYFFEVFNDYFEKILDIWSHFYRSYQQKNF